MNLAFETTLLTLGMLAICVVPFFFRRLRSNSNRLFLFGTGALFGICFFDLIPDLVEFADKSVMGGRTSLALTLAVSLVYSLAHLLHLRRHQNEYEHSHDHVDHHHHSWPIFYFSIVSHCFASGILLAVSRDFSDKLADAVFLAIIGHKGYECVVFVSLLLSQRLTRQKNFVAIAIYCLALPTGVLTSVAFSGGLNQTIALYVSSVAVGSLVGCLIFDFMIPSLRQVKQQRLKAAWLVIGLVLTRIVMGYL